MLWYEETSIDILLLFGEFFSYKELGHTVDDLWAESVKPQEVD